ncbi:MAG: MliC family protein [Gammaproteobacteria bacterium]
MTRRTMSGLVLAVMLGACADDDPAPTIAEMRTVTYGCDDGVSIEVRYFPREQVAMLERDGQSMELRQQPAASGFLYGDGRYALRGKEDDLTLEIGRRAPIGCQAQ